MNNDLIAVLEYWEREKGISKDDLLRVVQESLLTAAKKAVGPARNLSCTIDPKTGEIKAWARLVVAEKVVSRHDQISLADARRIKPDAQLGDEVEVEVTPADFGRIASQSAKQALMQQLRRAEKALIFEEFKDRTGDIVSGVVRRFDRSDVIIDLGRYEAILPSRERVPTEDYQIGEQIRCYVKAVENTPRGPEIILSRADPEFVKRLFAREVSEINDGTIEIVSIAREPGFRTKMAVHSRDPKVDPVGACVGLRGQRVKNIVRELNNEKVDIIRWEPDIRDFVKRALSPAQVRSLEVDEANRRVRVIVAPDQLSLAIGKRGQNARLTSRLTGWHVDIEAEKEEVPDFEAKIEQAVQALAAIPGISEAQARVLVQSGFLGLEDLLHVEEADLAEIEAIGDQASAILEAARAEAARRTVIIDPGASGDAGD
ncbi:MAG: transcription termination/antitermination protein NusA [Verrucomicrobia bacterium]|nr:MAG: transcription termination/antitermination protein NusA [Verrucomicrobiota bacterium]